MRALISARRHIWRIIMESGCLCILLLLSLPRPSLSAATGFPTVSLHHSIDLHLNLVQGRLSATDRIQRGDTEEGTLALQLASAATALNISADGRQLPFQRHGNRLLIETGQAVALTISWDLYLAENTKKKPEHDEDPGYGVRAQLGTEGGFLAADSLWYPMSMEGLATYRTTISLPPGFWAVTAGRLVKKSAGPSGNRITFQADYPLPGLTLAAGRWGIKEDHNGRIPLYSFFGSQNGELADTYLSAARSYLDLYEKLFGPYPFAKFAIVENFFPTGYGFPSWTLLGKKIIRLPFIVKTSLGHEIAHSWWGNGVRVDNRFGNWSEGLTTYVADYLYKERQGPEAALDYRLKIQRDYTTLVPEQAMALKDFRSRFDKISQAVGYGKAAMLFHQIRLRTGDKAFWQALRRLANEKMFQAVDWMELIDYFPTTGTPTLQREFRPWLKRGDIPQLQLSGITRVKTDNGWQVSGDLKQLTPPYSLHLQIVIVTDSGLVERSFATEAERSSFRFFTSAQPLQLSVDPNSNLMRRLNDNEIPATVNSLRAATALKVYLDPNLTEAQKRSAKALLAGLRKPEADMVDGTPATNITASTSMLYVGTIDTIPERLRPPELTLSEVGEARFKGMPVKFETSLFSVWKEPNGGLRALFIPTASNDAAHVVRKIPHYGRYSDLLFDGQKNRLKMTEKPESSPLTYRWPNKSE